MQEALFRPDGDGLVATAAAGSPWHPALLHGGALSGLLMHRICTRLASWPGFRINRVTMDLLRSGPKATYHVSDFLVRDGGRLKLLAVEARVEDRLICRAEALLQKTHPLTLPAYAPRPAQPPPGPDNLQESGIQAMLDAKGLDIPVGFHSRIRLRSLTPWNEQGQGSSWIHVPMMVIEGEPVTPLTHLGMVVDLGNGVGQLNFGNAVGTINADINLALFRDPVSEWICLKAEAQVQEDGLGVVHSQVFDTQGAVGYIFQCVQPSAEFQSS